MSLMPHENALASSLQSLSSAGHGVSRQIKQSYSNNNNITSIALKSWGTRAQKRNKTKSLIIFRCRGHTGVIISLGGRQTI